MKSPLGRLDLGDDPPHYQDKLADVIRQERPRYVIETGLWKGLGAEFILKALDDNMFGWLLSIDPHPDQAFLENPISHPRFSLDQRKSQDVLPEFPAFIDFFIHDSDHSFECQSFEYEWAWEHVNPGGIIATDDPYWGVPPHRAWDKFLIKHDINDVMICGNAQYFRRP